MFMRNFGEIASYINQAEWPANVAQISIVFSCILKRNVVLIRIQTRVIVQHLILLSVLKKETLSYRTYILIPIF